MRAYSSAREPVLGGQLGRDGGRRAAIRARAPRVGSRRVGRAAAPEPRLHRAEDLEAVLAARRAARRRARGAASGRRRCRAALQTPAMLPSEPFGFASGVDAPAAVGVAEDDLAVALERRERRLVGDVAALAVLDRAARAPRRARQPLVNGVSDVSTRTVTTSQTKLSDAVAHQRARQQARLAQDLEAVADAEHEPAGARVRARPPP